ncbi:hypothetical protein [Paraburkholderia caribensis]|uniref:hypothetical protein n=1 Tax=Paraburkholderia caribensis TaxID=75105 RepID=UPI0009EB7326|nr:hypothetical protein [Paraburkholderia caribensis]
MSSVIDQQVRLLAAVAYGEASTANDSDEIGGIAFAVANRCRAWGNKTVSELRAADPNYSYAWDGSNARFNKLTRASDKEIEQHSWMKLLVQWAQNAIANKGSDPSSGAFWWDGLDFKTNYANHPKVRDGFKWGDPSHNIFDVQEKPREVVVRWKIKNNKTGKVVDGGERGRYDSVWVSTAAHGNTIFWVRNPGYLQASGGKTYR